LQLAQDHGLDKALDQQLIVMSREALDSGKPVRFSTPSAMSTAPWAQCSAMS